MPGLFRWTICDELEKRCMYLTLRLCALSSQADISFSRSYIVLGGNMLVPPSLPRAFWTKRLPLKSKQKRRVSRFLIQVDITVVFDAVRPSPSPGGALTC